MWCFFQKHTFFLRGFVRFVVSAAAPRHVAFFPSFEALPRFRLVDVPGLGFARVSHELRERWIALIGGVILTRARVTAL